MKEGATYTYDGIVFTYVDRGVYDSSSVNEGKPWLIVKDDKGNFFSATGLSTVGSAQNGEEMEYCYPLNYVIEDARYQTGSDYIPQHEYDGYELPQSFFPTIQPYGIYRAMDGTMKLFE